MTSDTCIDTLEVGPYTVELHQDDDPGFSPREHDNVGTLSGYSRRSNLLDEDRAQDAGAAYRSARQAYGSVLALPIVLIDGPWTIVRETDDWGYADGIYYMPLADIETHGWTGTFIEQVKAARDCMRAELTELNAYLAGEVYGYIVKGPKGDEESCWGFIGESEYAMNEGVAVARHLADQAVLDWAALPEWVRQTVLIAEEA